MSKPDPTLPCARQCAYWATECMVSRAGDRSVLEDEEMVGFDERSRTRRCWRIAAVIDVTKAADDPRPVLLVSPIGRGRGQKGGSESSEEI